MNTLLISLFISIVSTIMIICASYKERKTKTNDYIKYFIIIFSGSFFVNLFNSNKTEIKTEVISPRLGNMDNISRPPF